MQGYQRREIAASFSTKPPTAAPSESPLRVANRIAQRRRRVDGLLSQKRSERAAVELAEARSRRHGFM